MRLYGLVLKICAENLNALCAEAFMCDERTEWIQKQDDKAAKKLKKSERRCIVDDDISECDFVRLRGDLTALRSTYQEYRGFVYDDYRIGNEEEIKTFF
jgi:hypothetical protein